MQEGGLHPGVRTGVPISHPAGTCRHFTTHPPAGQVLRHTVSRNILPRCENLLFNFFPLKGKNTRTKATSPPPPSLLLYGLETKPAVNTGTHRRCPLSGNDVRDPERAWGSPSPGQASRTAGFSASAPRGCPDPALSGGAWKGASRQLFAEWGVLGSSECPPEVTCMSGCSVWSDCECPGQALPACVLLCYIPRGMSV